MKNILTHFVLGILLCGAASAAYGHKIHLKDGSAVRSDTVWEETLGYFIDDVSLYAYKKSGIPEQTLKRLRPLQDQLVRSEERLLQLIRRQIGADALERYRGVIEKYLVKEEVVSYDKFGDTIHLDRSKVKRIEYSSPPPSLTSGYINPDDKETQGAIEAEKALLYERLRQIREQKSAYSADYKKEMRRTQEQIKELERNPLGYFLRYYPELVQFSTTPSSSDCYALCDGADIAAALPDGDQEEPIIRSASDEKLQRYKRCMASCLQEEPEMREKVEEAPK